MMSTRPPHMEEISKSKGTSIVVILGLMVFLLAIAITCSVDNNETTTPTSTSIEIQSFDRGKSVGRSAMMQYMIEKQDSLSVDFFRLLQIEDSIQKSMNYEIKY